jgi:hypothetical protein
MAPRPVSHLLAQRTIFADKPKILAPCFCMDENQSRQLSVARELMTSVDALPRVLAKIDQVLKLPDITETQAKHIESMAEIVGTIFLGIREAVDSDDYDRTVAGVDRLREEILTADTILDRLLKPETST